MNDEEFQFWVMSMLGGLLCQAALMEKRFANTALSEVLAKQAEEAKKFLVDLTVYRGRKVADDD